MLTRSSKLETSVDWAAWMRSSRRRGDADRASDPHEVSGETVDDRSFDSMRRQALVLREELRVHGARASLNVRCAVLDRLRFGADSDDLPEHLRPLMNRALDLVNRGDLSSEQAEDLERLLFEIR